MKTGCFLLALVAASTTVSTACYAAHQPAPRIAAHVMSQSSFAGPIGAHLAGPLVPRGGSLAMPLTARRIVTPIVLRSGAIGGPILSHRGTLGGPIAWRAGSIGGPIIPVMRHR